MNQNKSKKFTKKHPRQNKKWLPISIALAGVVLVGLAFLAFRERPAAGGSAIEVSGSPSLKVDQEKVDLGDIKLGKYVQTSFVLTNVGSETLRFSKNPYIEVMEGC